MARALRLDAGVADAIRAHGRETYPHECCGALLGADGVVGATVALPNTTEEGPRRRFLVRPGDYQQAEQAATGAGRELLGLLPLASRPSGPAIAIRPRPRLAVVLLRHRLCNGRRARRLALLDAQRRSISV